MASSGERRFPVTRKAYDKRSKALERSEGRSESDYLVDTVPSREIARRKEGLEGQQRVECELPRSRKHSEPAEILRAREVGLLQIKPTTINQAVEKRRSDVEKRKGNAYDRRREPTHTTSTTSRGDARERHPSGPVSEKNPRKENKATGKGMPVANPELEVLLAEVKHHEYRLGVVLSRLSEEPANVKQASQICAKLQTACMQLILSDLETFCKQNLVDRLWRVAHYPTTENLRKQLHHTPNADTTQDQLTEFLESSIQFYTMLINNIQMTYKFQLSSLLAGRVEFQSRTYHRRVMMAVIVCHSCYICLGDLSRYQEQLSSKPDWSKPRVSYLKAQQLAPKDGRPYNQLAIVAINAQRRLDAVYFYMRSLMAKNPFLSAHDSLVGLFEETSRKAKRQEEEERLAREREEKRAAQRKRKLEKRRRQKKQSSNRLEQLFSGRREVWIMPSYDEREGMQHMVEVGGEEGSGHPPGRGGDEGSGVVNPGTGGVGATEPESISVSELTKKLVSAFLVAHGKLFTKIGIETFDTVVERLLGLWQSVLRREVSLQDASRFLKMMVINIFSIHHAAERHNENDSGKLYYCSLGLSLALQFTTTLLQACNKHLGQHSPVHELQDTQGGDCPLLKGETSRRETGSDDTLSETDDSSLLQRESSRNLPLSDAKLEDSSNINTGYMTDPGKSTRHASPGLEATCIGTDVISGQSTSVHNSSASSLKEESSASTEILELVFTSPELLRALDVLSVLLPAARVWFDWLAHQKELWSQFFTSVHPTVLQEFGTSACAFLNRNISLCPGMEDWLFSPSTAKCPKLWEDKQLAGFMPLKAALSTEDTFAIQSAPQLSSEQHYQQCLTRVGLMAKTFRLLSDEGLLGITYDPEKREFSVVEAVTKEGSGEGIKVLDESASRGEPQDDSEPESEVSNSSSEDVVVEGYSSGEEGEELKEADKMGVDEDQDKTSLGIKQLKAQRKKLNERIKLQHLALETQETVLSEAANEAAWEVRVAPKYLVPDTNCFVDKLPSIRLLLRSGFYTLAVPLTVLAELEGLGKVCADSSERGKTAAVGAGAKSALAYITGEFSVKNANLRALTTQGSLLTSLSFRAEVTNKASNDDLILESCLNLHAKTDQGRSTVEDGASEFYSVVLLTDDRNLRVKAHSNHLPVRDVPAFMELARLES